jgi:putative ABC transport system substrate-binding protein
VAQYVLKPYAQPIARTFRVGFVSPLSASPEPSTLRAFRGALRELGYEEGKNLKLDTRFGEGRQELYPELVSDLLRLNVDVLLLGSDSVVRAGKHATTTVPIVFAGVGEPINSGLVASLAHPGGNITGSTFGVGDVGFGGKWLETLKEAAPRVSRVAVLSDPADSQTPPLVREVRAAAQKLNVHSEFFSAVDSKELDRALAAIGSSGANGMIVTQSPFFAVNRAKLAQFATTKRLPAMYFFSLFADAGGLMSYGGSLEDSYRRAAAQVDKIFKGSKPADIPVQQPTKFELVINMRSAKALGLKIPQSLLLRADRVIE